MRFIHQRYKSYCLQLILSKFLSIALNSLYYLPQSCLFPWIQGYDFTNLTVCVLSVFVPRALLVAYFSGSLLLHHMTSWNSTYFNDLYPVNKDQVPVLSQEFSQGVVGGCIWEKLKAISKLLSSTYFKIKGNCLLKALKFKCLKYTRNTEYIHY